MISVVIPLYNKAHVILNTLKTVFAQTYTDFEIVIVDDGSTDNGAEVIKSEYADEARVRIITQENQGVSVARNRGIEEAKGELIAFLDADDEWLPQYLETLNIAAVKYSDYDLFLTARYSQNFKTKKLGRESTIPKYKSTICPIDFFENPHVCMHITATAIRRSLLSIPNNWNRFVIGQKMMEDFTYIFRIALHTQAVYIGFPLAIYNGGIDGQVTSASSNEVRLRDSVLFSNLVWDEWYKTGSANKTCKIFMQYQLRHQIKGYLNQQCYSELSIMLEGLSESVKRDLLSKFEFKLYLSPSMNKFSKIYILLTKLWWRRHNYPRVR